MIIRCCICGFFLGRGDFFSFFAESGGVNGTPLLLAGAAGILRFALMSIGDIEESFLKIIKVERNSIPGGNNHQQANSGGISNESTGGYRVQDPGILPLLEQNQFISY